MARTVKALKALCVLCVLHGTTALAQPLPDPTRPPSVNLPAAGGAAATGMGMAGAAGDAAAPAVLQSVILRPGAKPRALLAGQWVELGQEYNGARLVKVMESSVVLKGPTGRETFYLTPDAEKKIVKRVTPRSSGESGGKQ